MDSTTPLEAEARPPKPRMTVHVFTVDRYGRVTRDLGIRTVSVEPDVPPEPLPLRFPACACPRHRTAVTGKGVAQPPTVHAVRAEAGWFLAQQSLPRHQTVAGFGRDFAACVAELIPRVERAAREQGRAETVSAVVADARHRLGVCPQPGLVGEVTRVKGLARCVVALGEHYDVLVQGART
ncbi:DUF6415 family natural product biosynthesis protein [Streptomyces acidiscabies]|uniref:DUF6415 family natural product biosynthesis protein n=1 Tax=Streptomyces acidiscabies TaxID=42234 RepID=UPI00131C62E7|nr:DUF6415 family natural product biosynthesis protein [Streptomyces acidiscabies]